MRSLFVAVTGFWLCAGASAAELPGKYFQLMQAGIAPVENRFAEGDPGDLAMLEKQPGWRHFPHALLVAAVLYTKRNPANTRYHDAKMLALAKKIGDLVAKENQTGAFTKRLDHHRDLYMWLEAYRVLEKDLEPDRRAAWRSEIEKNLEELSADVAPRVDFGAYISPFIGTSPNHYSLWSSTLHMGGIVFGNRAWRDLGARVMHRFVAEEQAPDGYWGEHDITGPTTGYDNLTMTAAALYYENSKDPAALEALRRSNDFHTHFTYPDGRPVEVVNDRNRYWEVNAWGHFGFSHFPDGRRFAAFLASHFEEDHLDIEDLGRVAQSALYYHNGPSSPIPQDSKSDVYRMKRATAGIRKSGPWVVCLSGLISTQAPTNQFYLDRQGHVSVFHEKAGLIITGANSKRQPELATFWEKLEGETYHMPQAARLRMAGTEDRLSLAYNSFFSDLYVPAPKGPDVELKFRVTPKGRRDDGSLNLQVCLKAGETLETGSGKQLTVGTDNIELGAAELGGWIRHRSWTLKLDPGARLSWPVYPFNPYGNGPEKSLRNAVAVVSVPIQANRPSGQAYGAGVQEISFTVRVE
ncbi:MAG TPA: hypothetical protein VLE22_23395 [Bryobacteraceae bacterium]|nr:hypothetical protein [Bryobacteraceae bacterium]